MLQIIFAIVAFVQFLFTVISLIAASDESSVLRQIYWTKAHGNGGVVYYGLFAEYQNLDYHFYYGNPDGVFKYASDKCSNKFCDDCSAAGQVVVAFSVFTLLSTIAAMVFFTLRYFSSFRSSFLFKILTLVTSCVTLVASALCIIVWGGQCQATIDNEADDSSADITVGPGYGLAMAVTFLSLILIPLDLYFTSTVPSTINEPMNPSAPYINNGFNATGVVTNNPMGNFVSGVGANTAVAAKPAYCAFCGKKSCREYPSHPEETTRFCSMCGRRHIVEEGLKYCGGCGAEIKF